MTRNKSLNCAVFELRLSPGGAAVQVNAAQRAVLAPLRLTARSRDGERLPKHDTGPIPNSSDAKNTTLQSEQNRPCRRR